MPWSPPAAASKIHCLPPKARADRRKSKRLPLKGKAAADGEEETDPLFSPLLWDRKKTHDKNPYERPVSGHGGPDTRPFVLNLAADLPDPWAAGRAETDVKRGMQNGTICSSRIRAAREQRQPPLAQEELGAALERGIRGIPLSPRALARMESRERCIRDDGPFALSEVLSVSIA